MQMSGHGLEFKVNKTIYNTFKHLWQTNGNCLSSQYIGTASTTSALTNGEKEGIMDAMSRMFTSVSRFVVNNFEDTTKQKCIEILLGMNKSSSNT